MSFLKSLFNSLTSTGNSGGFSGSGGGYSKTSIHKEFIKSTSNSEPKTELGRAIKDIIETTEQTKQEMQEIVIDTARDIVGLGPSDKKVANETKEEAGQIIAKATTKLERKRANVEKKHSDVKTLLDQLLIQKKSLLKTTITESQNLTILFENTDWESRLSPTFNQLNSTIQLPSKNFTASFAGYNTSSADLINLFLKKQTDKANLNAAKEYLEEAKSYRSEVNYQVEKMKIIIANLDFTKLVITEEQRILSFLEEKLKILNIDLTQHLNKTNITVQEVEDAKNIYKMVTIVANTLKEKMFHEDSRVTKSYIENLKQLDSIMTSTAIHSPSSPKFKEYISLNTKIINY